MPSGDTTQTFGSLIFFLQVIAAAGSDEKCKLAMQRGAQFSVNYTEGSLREAVKKLVGDRGVHAAIDMVGGEVFLQALRRCVQRLASVGWWLGLCLPPGPASFLFSAVHFSCRHQHQREQLSGWVKRNSSRENQEMLKYSKNKIPNWKLSKK